MAVKKYQFFDDVDTWFNGTRTKTKKSKGGGGGSTKVFYRDKPKQSVTNLKNGVGSITGKKKLPQVVVKISGSSKGCDKAQAHINYIGRKGEVDIEDENGIIYKGDEQKQLLKAWQAMGMNEKDKDGTRREAFHIVFSMPEQTNPEAMKAAVKNVVDEEFSGHNYFIAQHLDTDKPHCHVLLQATDDRGARLNPRKADLHNYRVAFVNKLAEQGIEATTSRCMHRFKTQSYKDQGRVHKNARMGVYEPYNKPNRQQQTGIEKTHAEILQRYKEFEKTLSNQPPDNDVKTELKKMIASRQERERSR